MTKQKESKGILGLGVVTAIASSLCCITPVLALVAGSSGAASSFSWIEPARPYLIVITILVLAFAWWQKLKPVKEDDCGCEGESKPSFMASKKFLWIVTVFAIVMTLFPYYSSIFYPDNTQVNAQIDVSNREELMIGVEGMTCDACQNHIDYAVGQIDGVVSVESSYSKESAFVVYDKTKTDDKEIIDAINSTGYKAIEDE
ncbi:MAG: mercuric transport protein MerTP [Crocinitomicaceae bacterium]